MPSIPKGKKYYVARRWIAFAEFNRPGSYDQAHVEEHTEGPLKMDEALALAAIDSMDVEEEIYILRVCKTVMHMEGSVDVNGKRGPKGAKYYVTEPTYGIFSIDMDPSRLDAEGPFELDVALGIAAQLSFETNDKAYVVRQTRTHIIKSATVTATGKL